MQPIKPSLVQLGVPSTLSRRQAMQWVMAAVATSALPTSAPAIPPDLTATPEERAKAGFYKTAPGGYGVDPNLVKVYKPGDLWPLTFTPEQKLTATVLADIIIPADDLGPAASKVGVVEMVDEWISAPYPAQQLDRPIILDGLAWIDAESTQRFGKSFAALSTDQSHTLCDDICDIHHAKKELHKAAHFFGKFRTLVASAYYATPAGFAAIGYVGNIALVSFDGPPQEVLDRLGVTQTVK